MQIMKVEITGYISLSKTMSLRDELDENERAASDPLVGGVIFDAKCALETADWKFRRGARSI